MAEVNHRWGRGDWTPIVLVHENVDAELLASIYRAGDICLVSSLQDGMNLVAKEFIACQTDEHGVLVLSKFTGAAEAIDGAVLINPFNVDGFVAGTWRVDAKKAVATLEVRPFGSIPKGARAGMEGEGEGLVRFLAPEASRHTFTIAR